MEILDNSSIILSYYIQVYTYVTYTRNSIKFDPICLHWSNSNAGKMDQTWSNKQQLFCTQTSPGQSTIDAANNVIRIITSQLYCYYFKFDFLWLILTEARQRAVGRHILLLFAKHNSELSALDFVTICLIYIHVWEICVNNGLRKWSSHERRSCPVQLLWLDMYKLYCLYTCTLCKLNFSLLPSPAISCFKSSVNMLFSNKNTLWKWIFVTFHYCQIVIVKGILWSLSRWH